MSNNAMMEEFLRRNGAKTEKPAKLKPGWTPVVKRSVAKLVSIEEPVTSGSNAPLPIRVTKPAKVKPLPATVTPVTVQSNADHRDVCPFCRCYRKQYQSNAEKQRAYRARREK